MEVMLKTREVILKERYMNIYEEENRRVKKFINQNRNETNEQFRIKIDQGVSGKRRVGRSILKICII